MIPSGIKTFQEERTKIIKSLIQKACQILTEENIKITAKEVTKKVDFLAEKENVDKKYLVDEQTIGRNDEYSYIWKKYKKLQNQEQIGKKHKVSKKYDEFDLRDKYDMLMQDYIELKDEMKFLNSQYETLKQNQMENNNHTFTHVPPGPTNSKILQAIKKLVNEEAAVILLKEGKLIVKSYLADETKRYEFSEKEWESLCRS